MVLVTRVMNGYGDRSNGDGNAADDTNTYKDCSGNVNKVYNGGDCDYGHGSSNILLLVITIGNIYRLITTQTSQRKFK